MRSAHDRIGEIVRSYAQLKESTLCGSVSSHAVCAPLTFKAISKLLASLTLVQEVRCEQIFLGVSENNVTISVCFRALSNKKRKLNHELETRAGNASRSVRYALAEVKKQRGISPALEKETESTILAILENVRGPCGEQTVESWGLSSQSNSALAPKIVLSLRMAHGIAVSLVALKRAFGKSWEDGVVTLSDISTSIPAGLSLPTSEHGSVKALSGRASLIVFSAIAEPAEPAK